MDGGTGCQDSVLPERPPGAERRWTTMKDRGAWSSWHPSSQEQNPQEGEEEHLCLEGPHWGKGSPLEGPGYYSHLGGENRVIEPVCHLRLARCPCPLSESGLLQKKIPGMKQEVPRGAARGEPCPFLWIQPSPVGSRIWGGQRGQIASPGFWPGGPTGVRTRAGWQLRGR